MGLDSLTLVFISVTVGVTTAKPELELGKHLPYGKDVVL